MSTDSTALAAGAHTRTIVVAEDDQEMRRLIAGTLREEGYTVLEAADGMQLLDCIEHAARTGRSLAAIVSDLRMPWLSGMDVLAVLRAASATVPLILITAFGDEATHAEGRELGAAAVLDKPFDMDELTGLVAEVGRPAW